VKARDGLDRLEDLLTALFELLSGEVSGSIVSLEIQRSNKDPNPLIRAKSSDFLKKSY
jgi:hypothetical protein